jgi:hypothetical protein
MPTTHRKSNILVRYPGVTHPTLLHYDADSSCKMRRFCIAPVTLEPRLST